MADNAAHPLSNSANWNKPKTWVVPLEITCMVDDPTKYDDNMKHVISRIVNELRSICRNFDNTGKQLTMTILPEIKDAGQIEALKNSLPLANLSEVALESALERLLKKKGLA